MGDLGLLGIHKPEAYGGMGLDYSYEVLFSEELGRSRSGGVAMAIGVQTDMATPSLARFGSEELCNEFLVPAISGDAVLSIAVSESHAGSDVAAIKTNAKKDGEDVTLKASMAKLKVGRLIREVSDSCLQYWGGMGFMWDNPISRVYHDQRLTSIGGGADEVMLSIICKQMNILPSKKK
jgi:alkylation response protein AidB-like acyl-CoA dehydrogenase